MSVAKPHSSQLDGHPSCGPALSWFQMRTLQSVRQLRRRVRISGVETECDFSHGTASVTEVVHRLGVITLALPHPRAAVLIRVAEAVGASAFWPSVPSAKR